MGLFEQNWKEADRLLRLQLEPQLVPGEQLVGVVHANQQKTFSAKLYALGVTPVRLILVPIDRKFQANGPVVSLTRDVITGSSVWGWGGSVGDFLSSSSDQQIRIDTPDGKFKLMVLGGNILEDALSGAGQRSGLDALVEFLISARG